MIELYKALAKAQGEMDTPKLDGKNPHLKSSYATLSSIRNAVMPALLSNGLVVIQTVENVGDDPAVKTILAHESGESIESTISIPPAKRDPQGYGSAITYMRRYSLMTICGVVGDDDDDGNLASKIESKKAEKEVKRVSAEQAAQIDALMEETGSAPKQVYKWIADLSGVRVFKTADIPEAKFDQLMTKLNSKKGQK